MIRDIMDALRRMFTEPVQDTDVRPVNDAQTCWDETAERLADVEAGIETWEPYEQAIDAQRGQGFMQGNRPQDPPVSSSAASSTAGVGDSAATPPRGAVPTLTRLRCIEQRLDSVERRLDGHAQAIDQLR